MQYSPLSDKENVSLPIKGIYTRQNYSATTRTGALERRLSNHNVFRKQKILKVFLQTHQ